MIHIAHLTKQIPGGPKVLDDISFRADEGEFIAVKGASGSGKSMLLRCLSLQVSWTSGKYTFEGKEIPTQSLLGKFKIRKQVAYLEEKPTLYPGKTALKNVLIGSAAQTTLVRRVTGMVRNDDYMGAMDMLEKMGLLDKAHQRGDKLSGGEKQRVAIAQALVHGAHVLLADEPVSGLDPHSAEAVLRDLKALCKQQGVIVIAVLHQGDWAERFADRIIGLNKGKIVLQVNGRRLTEREKMLL
ncbi:phosphonate ABC transporter ATP-binding protein [Paenibacillus beijingensis]|uniref:Phosphonate ABC transporter ATP-binding protein n=1 Tax=Paenibacillus beijingensis TaxID=1126833 RepID=A0A0D5NP38_9BACL|nr:ATP-binding cassette domain-containing protein [Paenibacillus beijingensis]AJY77041.1 phosphonate ABC transporter ATP-binding protein [Paenibacillus beijingensis]